MSLVHTRKEASVNLTVWREEFTVHAGKSSAGEEDSIQGLTSKMMFIHRQQANVTVLRFFTAFNLGLG